MLRDNTNTYIPPQKKTRDVTNIHSQKNYANMQFEENNWFDASYCIHPLGDDCWNNKDDGH